mmetsp:Transcript_41212/g.86035  ORF Transcript_41212/g.86035 Transcript_41212/m.86035 type:complete len:359 (+) Transcript_41212:543-1619(+)
MAAKRRCVELPQNLQPQLTSRWHAKPVAMRVAAVEKPVSPDEGAAVGGRWRACCAGCVDWGGGERLRGCDKRAEDRVGRQGSAESQRELAVQEAGGVGASACVHEGGSRGRGGGIEFEGRARVLIAGPERWALTVAEALAREEVGWVSPARNMHHLVLVLCEQIEPPSLIVAEVPLLLKPQQACIVRVQLEGLVEQVRTERLQGMDHRQQLQEVGGVQTLRLGKLARLEGDGVERAGVVGLLQDGRHCQLRGVSEEARRPRRVPHAKNRGSGQRSLESGEALLLRCAPAERGAWTAESRQRGCQGGKAQHELAVVIGQANEAADLCARSGLSPLSDCCNLAGVDGDAVLGDDMTEEPD